MLPGEARDAGKRSQNCRKFWALKSSAIGQLFAQRLHKRLHVVANNAPECVVVDAKISVDQAIPCGNDLPPPGEFG
ncbi:MAG: hypothetical protein ACI8W7_004943 [Gammaproteobacteria bacterium]|jgi:hypothetical protein